MEDIDERTQELIVHFEKNFDAKPTHVTIGPGRVNLIGEHTDYNDGFVLPVAIKRDVRLVMRPRTDDQVRLFSLEYNEWADFSMGEMERGDSSLWAKYVQGVIWALQQRNIELTGLDALISGNVPRASGLSSSAALEIAVANAFLTAAGATDALDGPQIALAAQQAENDYVGVNCGIMDQFISQLGSAGHALLVDCRSLDYQLIPMPENAALVIGNTKASRSLAGSAYNERRAECEEGVTLLQNILPEMMALRDVTSEQLDAQRALFPSAVFRRCRHVVGENERVLQTIEALKKDDLATVGRLMRESHVSLRDDYEVSSEALDVMVDAMNDVEGCYGARLTGAGFGGCTVALVQPGYERAVADAIFDKYPKATGIWPEVYTTHAADGARVVAL